MEKLPEFSFGRSRRVTEVLEVLVVVVPVPVPVPEVVPVVVAPPVKLSDVPCGGNSPSWRSVLRSASRIVASTSTSGLDLSRSSIIFSAIAIRSGVSRMMIAFIAVLDIRYRMLSSVRSVVMASVSSVAVTLLVR